MSAVRIDALEGEPVGVGTVFTQSDVLMLSLKQQSLKHSLQVIDGILNNVDISAYPIFLVILSLVVIVMCAIDYQLSNGIRGLSRYDRQNIMKILRYGVMIIWSTFRSTLNQLNYDPHLCSNKILWTHTIVAIFILIVGYVLNLMRTEFVAHRHAHQLDTLEEYLDPSQKLDTRTCTTLQRLFLLWLLANSQKWHLIIPIEDTSPAVRG